MGRTARANASGSVEPRGSVFMSAPFYLFLKISVSFVGNHDVAGVGDSPVEPF